MMLPAYGPEEAQGIWVYLEQEGGVLEGVSRELLGKGRELADQRRVPLTGLLLGHEVGSLAAEAIALGADCVLQAEHPRLRVYTTDPYTLVVDRLVRERKPETLLLGATPNGRDLAGRLAVRLRTGLTADCTDLTLEPGSGLLLGEVTGFGGGILAVIKCPSHRPQMATVRPGIFAPQEANRSRPGRVERVAVEIPESVVRTETLERVQRDEPDLTRAGVIVAGGRGVRGDFKLLREMADLLRGEVGASRVAVDAGWISRDRQIGQTGYVTRPKLAVACGISGAMHFTVGIKDAGMVIAINADPDAPIFDHADYCLVDDLFQVLPPLIEAIRAEKREGEKRP